MRHERVVSAGVVLPLSESGMYRERFGTRHRAALGITEQTDAIAVVVSEETGSVSLVERGRIVRDLDEPRLVRGLIELLEHVPLTTAIPERATALGRTFQVRRPSRSRRAPDDAAPDGPDAAAAASAAASGTRPE